MQTLEQTLARGPLAAEAAALFAWGSQWPLARVAPVAGQWQPFLDLLGDMAGAPGLRAGNPPQAPDGRETDPQKAVVLFSGGKDGLAAAISLRARGLRPALLHVRGINGGAYTKAEAEAAEAAARIAGFPLRVLPIKLVGKSDHTENPTKNIALAALGAALALQWGAGVVALGVLTEDRHVENIACGISDHVDLAAAGCAGIEDMAPGLSCLPGVMPSEFAGLALIHKECPDALRAVVSCMTGQRFRESLRRRNMEKFGVDLPPGRCGSCYKCATEQIALAALDGRVLGDAWADHLFAKLRAGYKLVRQRKIATDEDAVATFFDDYVPWRDALPARYASL